MWDADKQLGYEITKDGVITKENEDDHLTWREHLVQGLWLRDKYMIEISLKGHLKDSRLTMRHLPKKECDLVAQKYPWAAGAPMA
ncbi:hypothetical protein AX14_011077 [Amanita brunnescens Koide BX004]|nr:hypothetical protein AX14_011077 [Amanita brunnescens Koide BX004]